MVHYGVDTRKPVPATLHPINVTGGERCYIYNVMESPNLMPLDSPVIRIPEWLAKVLEYIHYPVIR